MIWKERKKLKYLDCSNENEKMTKIFRERFLIYFKPFTENSMKGVNLSYRVNVISVKFVKNTMIWNERRKFRYLGCSDANEIMKKNL